MPTLDKITAAERQLAAIKECAFGEDYVTAVQQLQQLQHQLQQIFAESSVMLPENTQRIQKLENDFSALISTLSAQRQQIKDSIGKIAGVKSTNKISKTYKTD